jgi:hypothetical protein
MPTICDSRVRGSSTKPSHSRSKYAASWGQSQRHRKTSPLAVLKGSSRPSGCVAAQIICSDMRSASVTSVRAFHCISEPGKIIGRPSSLQIVA